ncbi:TldD/PmbA family protein [Reinekea blandensis]|uniref:Putative PmbA-related protein n=1 Tax=Reinekea blandensis MED297 TaxID=314283 RepID=A4BEA4_9GAMM|nr:TldD/PmbA family protein [Reinekea blandensis]EAR09582.1 putative PmbA-related protein [Reinekea blandensis MED297]
MTQQSVAERLLNWAKDAGAEADLIVNESRSLSLKALNGALEEHNANSALTLGLRVVHENRVGTAYSEATDEDALRFMLDQALMNARYSEARPEEQIAPVSALEKAPPEDLNPEDETEIETRIQFAIELESRLAGKERIRNVPYNGVSDVIRSREVYSTQGAAVMQSERMQYAYAMPLAADGDDTAMQAAMQAGRHFGDLDLDALIDLAYRRSTELLGAGPVATGHYDVLFDANVQAQLFQAFSQMWSGKWAQDGINPFRDRLGKTVFDDRLTIVDRPRVTDGLAYAAFDAEGVPTQETQLVKQGCLTTLIHNTATGRHFGVSSTGHAARTAKTSLNVGLHQLFVLPGPDSEADLSADTYLVISKLDGLHSGINPVSGEFSCGASGALYRDGERVQMVRGITVAGNLYKMLNQVRAVGDSVRWDDQKQSCMAPIRFMELAVSGA